MSVWPHERTFFVVHSTRSLNRQKCYVCVFYAREPMAHARASPHVGLLVFARVLVITTPTLRLPLMLALAPLVNTPDPAVKQALRVEAVGQ